ncbi:hypothetical protein [Shouchella shacheensis]|uniref:hypothetical protein n=1 Tax=Shouchella shacheensis TaxID=1649580 RepID=UPI0007400108|nr:hypothetical protein [Shouchella shacheensis]
MKKWVILFVAGMAAGAGTYFWLNPETEESEDHLKETENLEEHANETESGEGAGIRSSEEIAEEIVSRREEQNNRHQVDRDFQYYDADLTEAEKRKLERELREPISSESDLLRVITDTAFQKIESEKLRALTYNEVTGTTSSYTPYFNVAGWGDSAMRPEFTTGSLEYFKTMAQNVDLDQEQEEAYIDILDRWSNGNVDTFIQDYQVFLSDYTDLDNVRLNYDIDDFRLATKEEELNYLGLSNDPEAAEKSRIKHQ